ncbi:MAG TPA: MFS transporter [Chloroflexia bacterium]|nr:MFS transporter [Chloroflexia bacterium]
MRDGFRSIAAPPSTTYTTRVLEVKAGAETEVKDGGPGHQADPEAEGHLPPLKTSQALYYSAGGIAGGLVFTMMNNALPLFLLSYTMPLGLPAFLNPGGPVPATIAALLTNERSLFGGLIQPFVGQLSDRTRSPIGKRSPYILGGGLLSALAICLLGFHPPFWAMVLAVTLSGIFLFVALGPYATLLADIATPGTRGRIGGLMALAGVLGAVCFTVLSMLLWAQSKVVVFLLVAVGTVTSLAVVAFGVHEPPSLSLRPMQKETVRDLWHEVAADKPLARYIAAMGVYWLGAGAAAPFITRFGVVELGVPEANSFTLLLVIVLATAVGAVISGYLADRYGKKRILQPALVLFAVAAMAGSQVRDVGVALPVMLLVGLGNAAPTALHIPLLADLVDKQRAGALMGFGNMVWSVAQPVGSLLAGTMVDFSGSYRWVFVFAAVCMAIAALMLSRVPNKSREAAGT